MLLVLPHPLAPGRNPYHTRGLAGVGRSADLWGSLSTREVVDDPVGDVVRVAAGLTWITSSRNKTDEVVVVSAV